MPDLDRRTLLRASLGAATIAVVGGELATTGPASAQPSAEFPWIIDCDSWGARQPSAPLQLSGNVTNKIIVHHMAFPNVTDYSRDHAMQLARDCQDLHMDVNGWSDTGQHFTVSRGGYVTEGRRGSLAALEGGQHQMIGAHCPGENGNAIGIENEGTYITETPTPMLLASLTKLCVAVCRKYGLHAYDIFGHWDFRETQCPGEAFYRQFPMLRRAVAEGLGMKWSAAPARRWPDIWKFVGGPVVQFGQYLLAAQGYPVPVNGVFDAATIAAVQDWQARNGLPVDVDATFTTQTWETLLAGGGSISGLQYILIHKGWTGVTINGVYDDATRDAVRELQRVHGLPPNGKLSMDTWCAASGGIVRESFKRG